MAKTETKEDADAEGSETKAIIPEAEVLLFQQAKSADQDRVIIMVPEKVLFQSSNRQLSMETTTLDRKLFTVKGTKKSPTAWDHDSRVG